MTKLDSNQGWGFIQKEISNTDAGNHTRFSYAPLEYTPILAGTLTGSIYINDDIIQTFVVYSDSYFSFKSFDNIDDHAQAIDGTIDLNTGEITLIWNKKPGENHIVVSYEYGYEEYKYGEEDEKCDAKKEASHRTWTTHNGRVIDVPTFETFLSSSELQEFANKTPNVSVWDFNVALGDTIKEKYEAIYCECMRATDRLVANGAAGLFWIVTSPEIASIFETVTIGFNPAPYDGNDNYAGQRPLGIQQLEFAGIINSRWRLYKDTTISVDKILIGCNDTPQDLNHYGVIVIENYLI